MSKKHVNSGHNEEHHNFESQNMSQINMLLKKLYLSHRKRNFDKVIHGNWRIARYGSMKNICIKKSYNDF